MFKLLQPHLTEFEIYGGAIRDLILNVEPQDIDINTTVDKFEQDKNKLVTILNQLNISYTTDYLSHVTTAETITEVKQLQHELTNIAKFSEKYGLNIDHILTDQRFINALVENQISKNAEGIRFILDDDFHIDLMIDAQLEFDLDVNTLYTDNGQIKSYRYKGLDFNQLINNIINKVAHEEDYLAAERYQKFINRGWTIIKKNDYK